MQLASEDDIVLVDDSEVDAHFLQRWISRSGLRNPLRTFSSGRSFLAHMESVVAGDARMPGLVLMDINMPGLDGFDVLTALRQRSAFQQAPQVVLYTNSDNPHDKQRAASLGAGFVEKFSSRAEAVDFLRAWGTPDA